MSKLPNEEVESTSESLIENNNTNSNDIVDAKEVAASLLLPEEEIELQAINAELSTFDQKVASLKDRLATATLQDDAETVASLKAEYKTLMGD